MKLRKKIVIQHQAKLPIRAFLVGFILLLLILQVVVSNRIAISGNQITQIEQKLDGLKQSNNNLGEKIASASSLTVIREKSLSLGFTKNITPYYVSTNLPVALELH
ncbi:MAG: hypothetical protein UR52_C0010G0007 [Candidatus Gottesmanbacteria bacterium GW2011_GWA1_34_13]|uniref:Cell division protein FtsL n=1 Tax=Candidatus Gottesmanbacteria bacterium GW2011_GWA1_34_13 TaxID=1618434 RepID=A0A0G0AQS9_9BACT|nr:MAG: hypothetical protein UR52_C0010G0007 [Candidatus Gottesmanbacteria bacterium GW2011_GWA1_34_13]